MGIVTDVILPLALAFIMFSLGLGLTGADFLRIAKQPRDFLVGLVSQIVLLPVIAFALLKVLPVTPELALGVMIIAAAPGGVTSNILTAFGRGDVALSISMTAVVSLLCVVTIPLIVIFAYAHFIGGEAGRDISVTKTAVSVFVIVTVPVLLGMAVRHFAEPLSRRIEPAARHASTVLFVLVLIGAIVQQRENIIPYFAHAGAVTLALNLVMMGVAYGLAKALATGPRQRVAIAIECGLQNGTLAIAVATLLFGGGLAIVPAATYSLIMFATALIFIAVIRKRIPLYEAE